MGKQSFVCKDQFNTGSDPLEHYAAGVELKYGLKPVLKPTSLNLKLDLIDLYLNTGAPIIDF